MQSGARHRLVVRRGPQPNQQYDLTRDTITIGRDITNDIVISDPEVSRHHARLVQGPAGYVIEDLRSTNGTFINRERISTPHQLHNGDVIGVGETVMLVYEVVGAFEGATLVGGREAPAPPPPAPAAPVYRAPYPPAPPAAPVEYEEPETDRNRWLVIGCAVLTIVFCCALVGAAITIDSLNLYCDIPIMNTMEFFCVPVP